jgi:carbon-monoxide dehydrogenase medium subunit
LKNFEYFDPTSIGDAVALLRQHAGSARVLAGGTDMFLRMHRRAVLPDVIVVKNKIKIKKKKNKE